jgi:hypothetical protein
MFLFGNVVGRAWTGTKARSIAKLHWPVWHLARLFAAAERRSKCAKISSLWRRRFLIELEAGKPSCQLGRSLLVAEALGLSPADFLGSGGPSSPLTELEMPDLPDEMEESDGRTADIL